MNGRDYFLINPHDYIEWLKLSRNISHERATEIMREDYKETHGAYPEDHKPVFNGWFFGEPKCQKN